MIGENIRFMREKLHITQEELGKRVGVSKGTISSWEVGRTEPNLDMLIVISEKLGCLPIELMTGDYSLSENHSSISHDYMVNADGIELVVEHIPAEQDLNPRLNRLIKIYSKLNEVYKEKLMEYATDLLLENEE